MGSLHRVRSHELPRPGDLQSGHRAGRLMVSSHSRLDTRHLNVWRVAGPFGTRQARSWPAAVDLIAQDIKTALVGSGMVPTDADDAAWTHIRAYAEMREPFALDVLGRLHEVSGPFRKARSAPTAGHGDTDHTSGG
jgi:hypothetical protein